MQTFRTNNSMNPSTFLFLKTNKMDCIELMKHYPDKYFDLAVVDIILKQKNTADGTL